MLYPYQLQKCLNEAETSLGFSLDEYSDIVASICEGTFSALKPDVEHPDDSSVNVAPISCEDEKKTRAQDLPSKTAADEYAYVSSARLLMFFHHIHINKTLVK